MLKLVASYERGQLELGKLIADLRGLFVEADPHDQVVRSDFEAAWALIDAEYELRTEVWAPPGSASNENLQRSLDAFRIWVEEVLAADSSEDHR